MGILLIKRAAFPLARVTLSFWKKCLTTTDSSFPRFFAAAMAIRRNSFAASLCPYGKVLDPLVGGCSFVSKENNLPFGKHDGGVRIKGTYHQRLLTKMITDDGSISMTK